MSTTGTVLIGVAIAIGLVGVVVPILPGALLVWAAVLVWALIDGGSTPWLVLTFATVAIGLGQIIKYLVPGRRLRDAGIPNQTLVAGVVVAVIGFFVIPVVGFFLGFPLGVYLEERRRLGAHRHAWASTTHALRAIGLSIVIELASAVLAAAVWFVAVLV